MGGGDQLCIECLFSYFYCNESYKRLLINSQQKHIEVDLNWFNTNGLKCIGIEVSYVYNSDTIILPSRYRKQLIHATT